MLKMNGAEAMVLAMAKVLMLQARERQVTPSQQCMFEAKRHDITNNFSERRLDRPA